MEAVPRLPMIKFELNTSVEKDVNFGAAIKQYIAAFYNEDPESYNNEIHNLEGLRAAAVKPSLDVNGCQLLKKYYCQLHFLKSRFPMEEDQVAAVNFSWRDAYTGTATRVGDIRFEIMGILYNIGAIHTQLGADDTRATPEGMKMACTHFQCAAWAFNLIKEQHSMMLSYISYRNIIEFMELVSLGQAQECILEKSMMDNRKSTIIAKVAEQTVEYYKQAQNCLNNKNVSIKGVENWNAYTSFKKCYHQCIALLFQGQQAEEQQKMGERVAFYQAASEQLEKARKCASDLQKPDAIMEALGFTMDVVEGKRKAATNENEFIYHEKVPEKDVLPKLQGASLVKGIPFNVNDPEISGQDIFHRLVPMEAHEASSLYSEKKAELLRQTGMLIEQLDQSLAEFMSSMQTDVINDMRQATGVPQELIDRAAALSARSNAIQDLTNSMGKLSNSFHEVESMLSEINNYLKEEETNEKEYQKVMGDRPPSIIATDLAREAAKYREAHNKANESNQNLHKAMMNHVGNLKTLSKPLSQIQQEIPSVHLPDPNIDERSMREIETLINKVEEMRSQRAMLWAQLRENVHKDDITSVLVTRAPEEPLEQVFQQELQKHQHLTSLIEQNISAQENIVKAFVEAYASFSNTRRYLQGIISKRTNTISALITSFDTYEDLLAKATKGLEFYNKLETNVTKLLQRIKSASKVQQEEREQMLAKTRPKPAPKPAELPSLNMPTGNESTAPKLKDYLDSMKKRQQQLPQQNYPNPSPQEAIGAWPPGVRPTPVGSEINEPNPLPSGTTYDGMYQEGQQYYQPPSYTSGYSSLPSEPTVKEDQMLIDKFNALKANDKHAYNNYGYPATPYMPQEINYPQSNMYNYGAQNQPQYPNQQHQYSNESSNASSYYQMQGTTSGVQIPYQNLHYSSGSTNIGYSGYSNSTVGSNSLAQAPGIPTEGYSSTYAISANTNNVQNEGYPYNQNQYSGTQINANYAQYHPAEGGAQAYTNPTPTFVSQNDPTLRFIVVSSHNSTVGTNASSDSTSYFQQTPLSYDSMSIGEVSQTNSAYYYQNNIPPTNVAYNNSSMYTQAGNYAYDPNNTTASYGGVTTPNQAQVGLQQEQQYSYIPNVVPPSSISKPDSNIDLLTGLDFTISQAPLIPQQKTEPAIKEAKTVKPQVTSEPSKQPTEPAVVTAAVKQPEMKILISRPLDNAAVKHLFENEIDKYEKFVDDLTLKTLNGPTTLEVKWKEIQDKQDSDTQKKVISVARCYPMKNRFPDILPYDFCRVQLTSTKDDYVNASYIKELSPYVPTLIVTHSPTSCCIVDFWTMVKEQNIEFIACLASDKELAEEIYWPTSKDNDLQCGNMVISLQTTNVKQFWTERLFTLSVPEKRESFNFIHLQLTSWSHNLLPSSPEGVARYIRELVTLYQQQKLSHHPILIHCLSGVGRTGVACVLLTAMLEVANNPVSVPDVTSLAIKVTSFKRNLLRDREHLKFTYQAFLTHMKIILNKEMKTVDAIVPEIVKLDEFDPLSALDPFWASKK